MAAVYSHHRACRTAAVTWGLWWCCPLANFTLTYNHLTTVWRNNELFTKNTDNMLSAPLWLLLSFLYLFRSKWSFLPFSFLCSLHFMIFIFFFFFYPSFWHLLFPPLFLYIFHNRLLLCFLHFYLFFLFICPSLNWFFFSYMFISVLFPFRFILHFSSGLTTLL